MSPASTSVVESVPTAVPTGEFSGTAFGESVMSVGASLTATPVMVFVPLTHRLPSVTLVPIVKVPSKFGAGVKVSAARSVLTLAMPPLADQTPVTAL